MTPNKGIFQDGQDAAFLHGEPPTAHDYGGPNMAFQRWSWIAGYAEGLRMRLEYDAMKHGGCADGSVPDGCHW